MDEENIDVYPGNEYLVERFIREIYGSPHSWSGGEGFIVKSYPGLKIESKREFLGDKYKRRIVFGNIDNKIKDKLIYFATTKGLSFFKELSNIEKIANEIKNGFLFKIDTGLLA